MTTKRVATKRVAGKAKTTAAVKKCVKAASSKTTKTTKTTRPPSHRGKRTPKVIEAPREWVRPGQPVWTGIGREVQYQVWPMLMFETGKGQPAGYVMYVFNRNGYAQGEAMVGQDVLHPSIEACWEDYRQGQPVKDEARGWNGLRISDHWRDLLRTHNPTLVAQKAA